MAKQPATEPSLTTLRCLIMTRYLISKRVISRQVGVVGSLAAGHIFAKSLLVFHNLFAIQM